ncbi:hypothetical protein ACM66B_000991 [Microbotryomycetes sp. NB124-2]
MKASDGYLFEAIDARRERRAVLQPSQPRYDVLQLKQVVAEASEGLDDKTSMTDFIETLERIVTEIKNTTEHSGAFLQKVRKSDYPDYYEIIKRPMDLATLQKRVKQGVYRSKKAFAEDLDLIWSNCLIYNSLPTHPLRASAEFLRKKSNQLLEFISDPALPARSIYAQALGDRGVSRSNRGTPALDEDGEPEVESDVEMAAGIRAVQASRLRKEGSVASALPSGINGREASDSPMPSDRSTPLPERRQTRKLVRGPLGRETASVEPEVPDVPQIPFEERPAIIRTPQCMLDFLKLDLELERLDAELVGWNADSQRTKTLLPQSAFLNTAQSPLTPDTLESADQSQKMLLDLCRSLNPTAHPLPTPPTSTVDANSPSAAAGDEQSARPDTPQASTLSTLKISPDETPDELWWDTVSVQKATAPLASLSHPATVLAAGIPLTPWTGGGGEVLLTRKNKRKLDAMRNAKAQRKSGRDVDVSMEELTDVDTKGSSGLTARMRKNFETLRDVKRLHNQLANTSKAVDSNDSFSLLDDATFEDESERSRHVFSDPGIPRRTLQSHLGQQAATEAMSVVSKRVLSHIGFDSSSSTATSVLTHLAAEYLTNLGRSMRFFVDRYGQKFSENDIVQHTLESNGVTTPSVLSDYVSKDIDQYGRRLEELQTKLARARSDQLANVETGDGALSEDQVFARGCEALIAGETSKLTGEDYFGLADLGLNVELGASTLSVPLPLLRGVPKGELADCGSSSSEPLTAFTVPPPYPVLTPEAISSLPGLLQPYFHLRLSVPTTGTTTPSVSVITTNSDASTEMLGLVEDLNHSSRPKQWPLRPKVPPMSGRIPVKGVNKKKNAATVEEGGAEGTKKKKKKLLLQQQQQQAALAAATAMVQVSSEGL